MEAYCGTDSLLLIMQHLLNSSKKLDKPGHNYYWYAYMQQLSHLHGMKIDGLRPFQWISNSSCLDITQTEQNIVVTTENIQQDTE